MNELFLDETVLYLMLLNCAIAILSLTYMLNKKEKEYNNLYENVGKHLKINGNVSKPVITKEYICVCHNCKWKNRFKVNNKGQAFGFSVNEGRN